MIGRLLPGSDRCLHCAEAAAQLGLTEATVRSELHRLKLRFRRSLRDEIAQTIASPSDIDDEIRHLMAVFSS